MSHPTCDPQPWELTYGWSRRDGPVSHATLGSKALVFVCLASHIASYFRQEEHTSLPPLCHHPLTKAYETVLRSTEMSLHLNTFWRVYMCCRHQSHEVYDKKI